MNRASSATGWVRNPDGTLGYSWSPITGCLNHTNGLCNGGGFPCYAYRLAHGRLFSRYMANTNYPSHRFTGVDSINILDPFYPRFWPERIQTMVRSNSNRRKPRGIFVCDMSDLFGIGVPEEWTARVLDVCKGNWRDRFYLLTKQPQNLAQWSPFPDNCFVGQTLTGKEPDFYKRIGYLQQIEAKVKFISFEPLLATTGYPERLPSRFLFDGINWVIIGAQTKPYKPPKIEWVEEIVQACDKAGVKVFLKGNLWKLVPPVNGILGKYMQNDKGVNFYLRQEVPDA